MGMTNVSQYKFGRSKELQRLDYVRKHSGAILGSRFRGSKISSTWRQTLGFDPKLDLWYITRRGTIHFEQIKSSRRGSKKQAYISPKEISAIKSFASLFTQHPSIWVGYVIKNPYHPYKEVRLN